MTSLKNPGIPSRVLALRELRSPRELPLLVYASALAAAVPVVMRLPLPRVAGLITRPPRYPTRSPGEIDRLVRVVELAPRVGHPFVPRGCLTRGVTLFWLLRRAGLAVELCFGLDAGTPHRNGGVGLDGSDHAPRAGDGHCWLLLEGEPFLEAVDPRPRFAELYRVPSKRP